MDVRKGLIVWQYSGIGGGMGDKSTLIATGDRLTLLSAAFGSRKITLKQLALPEEDVKKTVAGLDLEQVMAVRPGTKVSLVVDIPDAQVASDVRAHFENQLKKNNMTIADDQPIKLRVKIGDLDQRFVAYRTIGRPLGGSSRTPVQIRQMTVAYEVSDKTLWNVVLYSGAPMLLRVEAGQSVQSAIAQKQADDWKQLQAVELPKYVPAYRDPPGFGQTALDVQHKR